MVSAKSTTDHAEIRHWVESHGGHPATVASTATDEEAGLLRIDFPGFSGTESLTPIGWDDFFEKFEEKQLAFLYQEEDPHSRFCKLVSRQ